MNHIILILSMCMPLSLASQKLVYDSFGKSEKVDYLVSVIDLEDRQSKGALKELTPKGAFAGGAALALSGSVVNFGFSFIESLRKERLKKFSSQYLIYKVNRSPKFAEIPVIKLNRVAFDYDGVVVDTVMQLELKPKKVNSKEKLFYYELTKLEFSKSEAKLSNRHRRVSMSLELEIKVIDKKGKPLLLKSSPIVVKQIDTNSGFRINENIYSSIFDRELVILEIGIKINQVNSTKNKLDQFANTLWSAGENLNALLLKISENINTSSNGGDQ